MEILKKAGSIHRYYKNYKEFICIAYNHNNGMTSNFGFLDRVAPCASKLIASLWSYIETTFKD